MKKTIIIILVVLIVISLGACSVKEPLSKDNNTEAENAVQKMLLGETASTDIIDFTLKEATLSYYASATSSTFAEPISQSDGGIFQAATGRTLVCLEFEVKNKDRVSTNMGSLGDWGLNINVYYNDERYPLRGFDLNNKDGSYPISLNWGVVSIDGGTTWKKQETQNIIIHSGDTVLLRIVTIAVFDPASLADPFDLSIILPSSSSDSEVFYYSIY